MMILSTLNSWNHKSPNRTPHLCLSILRFGLATAATSLSDVDNQTNFQCQGNTLPSNDVQCGYSKSIQKQTNFKQVCSLKRLACQKIIKCITIQHKIDNISLPPPGSPTLLEFSTSVGTNARWRPFARLGSPVKVVPCYPILDLHGSLCTQSHEVSEHPMAWHLIGSRNCVPSSWRQGVTSPSQVHSPMTICPQPQAQGRRRGLGGKNPNQERYNLTLQWLQCPWKLYCAALKFDVCWRQGCWLYPRNRMTTDSHDWRLCHTCIEINFYKRTSFRYNLFPYSPWCPDVFIAHHGPMLQSRLRLPLIELLCVLASNAQIESFLKILKALFCQWQLRSLNPTLQLDQLIP